MTFPKHEMEETLMSKNKVTDHSISRFTPSDFCSPEEDITRTFLFQLLKLQSCIQSTMLGPESKKLQETQFIYKAKFGR